MTSRSILRRSSPAWYVVCTKPRREAFARVQLERRGVQALLPRICSPGTAAPSPLFPNYLFLHLSLEEQFLDVVWTPGVSKFVAFGGSPTVVDDSVIDLLRERLRPDGTLVAPPVLQVGEAVRIRRGPLEGLQGILASPGSVRGRVRVLLEILRRQTRVELPESILERVSA